jgi:hypothetical protein
MKKLYIFLLFCVAITQVTAQVSWTDYPYKKIFSREEITPKPIIHQEIIHAPMENRVILLSEDFQSVSGTLPAGLPAGWSTNLVSQTQGTSTTTGNAFKTHNSTTANGGGYWPVPQVGVGNKFAGVNDDGPPCDCDNTDSYIQSPSMDFSAASNIAISFDIFHDGNFGGGDATLQISTDGGATFNIRSIGTDETGASIDVFPLDQDYWQSIIVPLYDVTAANVIIRFQWTDAGSWASGFAVDNVIVGELPANDIRVVKTKTGDWNQANFGLGFWDYNRVPVTQVSPVHATSVIFNGGTNDQADATMSYEVTFNGTPVAGSPFAADQTSAAFLSLDKDTISVSTTWTPSAVGTVQITGTATSATGDDVPVNSSGTTSIEITNFSYGRDGNAAQAFVGPASDFEIGNLFDIYADDQFGGIDVAIGAGSNAGDPIIGRVYLYEGFDANNNPIFTDIGVETLEYIFTGNEFNGVGENNFVTLPFASAVTLNSGNIYLVAVSSVSGTRIAVSGQNEWTVSWLYDGSSWAATGSVPMVRLNSNEALVPIPGCNNPAACNYNINDQNTLTCQYPGCTNIAACNYNANAGCDNGSCILINSPCNDNNPNTFNDVYTSSCNCSGSAFSYGNLDYNTYSLCGGENTQIAMIYNPVGLPSYSLQWYYKSGNVNAPFGSSTSGWITIPGATTSVVDVNSFVGSRTYACFVTTDGSMGLPSQWANGVSYVNYSSINAQAIIGNPNITPFNNYTYAVTSVVGNTYNWTVTNGAVISGQGTSVVSILWGQNGPYQVTLSESDGTCSGSSVLFAVNNNCNLTVSAASGTTTSFCTGASVQLQAATAATNITYQWYLNGVAIGGETNQNIAASVGGNYQVSITQNGCSAISQILAITELPGITMPTLVVDQANAGCSGSDATVSLTDANYNTITWSNGTVNTSSINVSESGSYTVTVTDNNGCTATSSAVEVNLSLVDVVPICLVTVDQTTGKNNVVWEPVTSDMINSYVILKETNVANVYAQIGTVDYGSNGLFEDVNANPQVQANRYKLALIDTCGILSSNSDFHKTIHLATNQGLGNNVNLIWSGYEGFDFGNYNIYRGASAGTMNLLTTIASNLDSYTDINPPVGEVYYMIEVEGVSCDPQRTLVYSHSNILDASVGVEEFASTSISIYPNPASTSINLQVNTSLLGQEYIVFDAIGKVIYKNKIQSTNAIIQIENFNNGNYFVKVNEVVKRFVVQH